MNKVKFLLKLPIAMVDYPEDKVKLGKLISELESLRVGPRHQCFAKVSQNILRYYQSGKP